MATQPEYVNDELPRVCRDARRKALGLQSTHDEFNDTSEAAAGHVPASFGPALSVMAGEILAVFDGA